LCLHTASSLQSTMWRDLSSSNKRWVFLSVFWTFSIKQYLWKLLSVFFVVHLTLLFQFQGVELLRILRWEESLKKLLWRGFRHCNGVFLKRDLKKDTVRKDEFSAKIPNGGSQECQSQHSNRFRIVVAWPPRANIPADVFLQCQLLEQVHILFQKFVTGFSAHRVGPLYHRRTFAFTVAVT
jgi:hypothetical protein